MKIIAEIKKASPFAGRFVENVDLENRIKEYDRLGAAAISIVTAPSFEGEKDWISTARKLTKLPILRKDFISTLKDLEETKELGADWVLLIVDYLQPEEVDYLTFHAWRLGLKPIIEVQSLVGLKKLKHADAGHIVINNRNLRTGEVNTMLMYNLLPMIGEQYVTIAASGLDQDTIGEIRRLRAFDYVLVGSLLMKSTNLEQTFKELNGRA